MHILFLALDINIKSTMGDSIHVRELVGALAKLGHKVDLIVAHQESGFEEINYLRTQQNVRIFFNKPKRYFKNISTLFFCKKVAKEGRAEVIYERRFSAKMGYSLGKILKLPYIVEINGLAEIEAEMQGIIRKQNAFARKIKKRFRRHFFICANKIVAVSQGIKDALVTEYKLPPDNIIIVSNGANINLFRKMDKMDCRQQLGLDKHNKYVCFTGNLAPWQGLITLIKAGQIVIKRIPITRFIIVGNGMMRSDLERTVDKLNLIESFIFKGWVAYEDVPKYINSSEVCVAPFIKERECSPIKVYEYLSCEKPVVASLLKGLEFLEDTNLGFLVRPDDPTELANAIIKVLTEEEMARDMGVRGRQYVKKNHNWLTVAKRIVEICERTAL